MTMLRRISAALFLGVVVAGIVAAPAFAGGRDETNDEQRRVNLIGGLVVAESESIGGVVVSFDGDVTIAGTVDNDVYVGRGDLRITGRVRDDVFVLKGDAIITGSVDGNVVVVGGRAIVREGGFVAGDVESGDTARIEGTVQGEVNDLDVDTIVGGVLLGLLLFLWLAVTIAVAALGAILLALFPKAADAVQVAGRERVGASFGVGAIFGILAPIAATAIASTIVGLPLGVVALAMLGVGAFIGYLATCLIVGRWMVKGTSNGARFGAFFAGFGVLRVIALIPGIGFLVTFVAVIYGIGAVAIAMYRAGRVHGAPSPPLNPSKPGESDTPTEPAPTSETPDAGATSRTTATKVAPAKKAAPAKKVTPTTKATSTAKATPTKKAPPKT